MSRFVTALLLAVVAALAAAQPAAAIDGGIPDGDGHPNVGLLAFDVDGNGELPPFALCSGSVIADDAFLTAGHCIAAIPGAQWAVTLAAGSPGSPVTTTGFYPDDFPFVVTGAVLRATGAVVHPGFRGGSSPDDDLAVVLFPPGTFDGVTPVELPRSGLLDELAVRGRLHGRSVTLVGYGTDAELGPPRFFFQGYRQRAAGPIQALTPRWLRIQQTSAATGQGGLCYGDSGSPQLVGANLAVSLFSHHATTCAGASRSQRLDTVSAHQFLSRFAPVP